MFVLFSRRFLSPFSFLLFSFFRFLFVMNPDIRTYTGHIYRYRQQITDNPPTQLLTKRQTPNIRRQTSDTKHQNIYPHPYPHHTFKSRIRIMYYPTCTYHAPHTVPHTVRDAIQSIAQTQKRTTPAHLHLHRSTQTRTYTDTDTGHRHTHMSILIYSYTHIHIIN